MCGQNPQKYLLLPLSFITHGFIQSFIQPTNQPTNNFPTNPRNKTGKRTQEEQDIDGSYGAYILMEEMTNK